MESVAKRYFWVINLLLIAGLAYLSARVANNMLAEKLVGIEPAKGSQKASSQQKTVVKGLASEWGKSIRDRNIFDKTPPEDEEMDDSDAGVSDGGVAESYTVPPHGEPCNEWENLSVRLHATLVAEPAEWSMATVDDGGNDRMLRVGDMIAGKELVAIQRERIFLAEGKKVKCVKGGRLLKRNKKRKSSRLSSGDSSYKPASKYGSKSKSSKKNSSAKIKAGVKKTGKGTYEIDREMLNEQLEDLGKLSRQARVIPHYRGGKPKGFKLVGVRPGSLYSHIGVRSGDILKSVNGEGITSPTKALELFEKLKSSDSVTVEIERRGKGRQIEYLIK